MAGFNWNVALLSASTKDDKRRLPNSPEGLENRRSSLIAHAPRECKPKQLRAQQASSWRVLPSHRSSVAISYCGLWGDEKSSADKVMRMPISKQRNKHIQRVLIEAAKLATRGVT